MEIKEEIKMDIMDNKEEIKEDIMDNRKESVVAKKANKLNKNMSYEIKIYGMTNEGLGVGKVDGFVVFVQNALPDEVVQIKIIKMKPDYAFGIVEKYITSSPHRKEAFCSIYKRCGGCSLQHMTYEYQLECKRQRVQECLDRIAGLPEVKVKETIGMEQPYSYRNKAQFPVGVKNDEIVAGFYARRTHVIIENDACDIQEEISVRIKAVVLEYLRENNISVYDEITGKGLVRHIVIRSGKSTGQVMLVLVVTKNRAEAFEALIEELQQKFPEINSIIFNINNKRTNTIMGERNVVLFGKGYIIDTIGEYQFRISPLSFFQVNNIQAKVLYDKVVEFAELKGNETVFDMYCGAGTIATYISKHANRVIGVDTISEAIQDAKSNAKLNDVNNVEFLAGKAEEVMPELYNDGIVANVVVLDPPRKGCHKKVLDVLCEMKPEKIVYVSCEPSTLARDIKVLGECGYVVKEVQPVDMFPWTEHVECVVGIQRIESMK